MVATTFANSRHYTGNWKCTVSGSEIELYPTDYGFKSRYLDQSEWINYDEVYHNYFVDQKGNHFNWADESWHWGDANGSKNMVYRPFNTNQVVFNNNEAGYNVGGYNDPYNYNNGYNANYSDSYDYENGSSLLDGLWHSSESRSCIEVHGTKRGLSVIKDRSGRWINFRKTGRNSFKNGAGDKIKILNRYQMEWRSHCGRYREIYQRGRDGYDNNRYDTNRYRNNNNRNGRNNGRYNNSRYNYGGGSSCG